jgi:hypothetical protein
MVVDDRDILGRSFLPPEADPPLPVDPDAVPPAPFALQHLELVARWHPQVGKRSCWFSRRSLRSAIGWISKSNRRLRRPLQILAVSGIGEALNHLPKIAALAL